MADIEKITRDYNKLKSNGNSNLLSLDKIVSLEQSKEKLINDFLSKILRIEQNFDFVTESGFKLDDLIIFCKNRFGDINFIDKKNNSDKIEIVLAFHFCIVSLVYFEEKIKFKAMIFWDI
ncbi:MAG TPA: hypothetical protein PLO89_00150 [Spirochaetota bacterium]|nr:hypothetical protein [Spirochaetota bacterium]